MDRKHEQHEAIHDEQRSDRPREQEHPQDAVSFDVTEPTPEQREQVAGYDPWA